MFLNRRVVLILLHCYFTISCESKTSSRNDRRLLSLLGYLHGYKIGYDNAFQLPPIVPIIVLPNINQHQSVSILKTIYDNKFQDNENNIQTALPAKLVSTNSTNKSNEYEDIEVLKQSIKRNSPESKLSSNVVEDHRNTLRQADNTVNINSTVDENTTIETSTLQVPNVTEVSIQENVTKVENNMTSSNTTEKLFLGYPTAMYNNEFVMSIQLTTEANEITELPQVDNEKFQNSTNDTQESESQPIATREQAGSYSGAFNDNNIINNLVLTTQVNDKDTFLPPVQDERWKNFSSGPLYENSGQFKPLAGLYYDGFLHRPLKKVGFRPRPNYVF